MCSNPQFALPHSPFLPLSTFHHPLRSGKLLMFASVATFCELQKYLTSDRRWHLSKGISLQFIPNISKQVREVFAFPTKTVTSSTLAFHHF